MFRKSYYADGKLEIIILGAMRGQKNDSSIRIRDAVLSILQEKEALDILKNKGITSDPIVSFPDEWQENQIEDGVFGKMDTADLIIVNLTPKKGKVDTSPNVFYELGFIHALGIPYILLLEEGNLVPFYMRNTRVHRTKNFSLKTLTTVLKAPLYNFITDENNQGEFTQNIISRFYHGFSIIDISAAVGLATGYYMNFVRRLLKDGGFISFHPDKIKHVIVIRPSDIFNTYLQDHTTLENILKKQNLQLHLEKLEPVPTDKDGGIWFEHTDGIVIDIPRTIYPLRRSPRLLSLRERLDHGKIRIGKLSKESIIRQAADKLLDKVEDIISYLALKDEEIIRTNLLHFTTLEEAPALIERIKSGNQD